MTRFFLATVLVAVLASIPLFGFEGVSAGDEAPDFRMPGSDGESYRLSQFVGKKPVVIAWYPKAFTGG